MDPDKDKSKGTEGDDDNKQKDQSGAKSFLDFSALEDLPEGLTSEMLASDAVQNHIKSSYGTYFQKRFDVEASGLKKTITDIKEEKTRLKEHLDAKNKIDPEEYKQLKVFKENNGDAAKQLDAADANLSRLKDSYEEKLTLSASEKSQLQSQLNTERLTNRVAEGIRQHNAEFPAVSLKPASEEWIIQAAGSVFVKDDSDNFIPMNGDRVIAGDSGDVMSMPEWVNSLRKLPKFADMFNEPNGGGAPGGSGGGGSGSGRPFNPKNLAGNTQERASALGALFPDLPDS